MAATAAATAAAARSGTESIVKTRRGFIAENGFGWNWELKAKS